MSARLVFLSGLLKGGSISVQSSGWTTLNVFLKCSVMLDIPDERRNHRRVPYLRLDDIDGVIEASSRRPPRRLPFRFAVIGYDFRVHWIALARDRTGSIRGAHLAFPIATKSFCKNRLESKSRSMRVQSSEESDCSGVPQAAQTSHRELMK